MANHGTTLRFQAAFEHDGNIGVVFMLKDRSFLLMPPECLAAEDGPREKRDRWADYAATQYVQTLESIDIHDAQFARIMASWHLPEQFWHKHRRAPNVTCWGHFKCALDRGTLFKKDGCDAIAFGNNRGAYLAYGGVKN